MYIMVAANVELRMLGISDGSFWWSRLPVFWSIRSRVLIFLFIWERRNEEKENLIKRFMILYVLPRLPEPTPSSSICVGIHFAQLADREFLGKFLVYIAVEMSISLALGPLAVEIPSTF